MKKAHVILVCLLFCCGCASFTTTQTDTSYEQGQPSRSITTKAKATTFFEAGSALSNFKASQTDKTQSAAVGALNQEATSTNASAMVEKIVNAAVRAVVAP